jgi:hypothetical protein
VKATAHNRPAHLWPKGRVGPELGDGFITHLFAPFTRPIFEKLTRPLHAAARKMLWLRAKKVDP